MSENETINTSMNGSQPTPRPDPEVVPRARRRQFSRAYKIRIVQEADRCTEPGQTGALLRREGLYSSHLSQWRRQRDNGQLQAGKQRGRKPKQTAAEKQVVALQQENGYLRQQLEQAELIIAAQKKLALALEQTLTRPQEGKSCARQ
jgi:transposase-like protein